MFDSIKHKIAHNIVNKKTRNFNSEKQYFNNLLNNSDRFLLLMPSDERYFYSTVDVFSYLEKHEKKVVVFTQDYRVSLLPAKYRQDAIDFNIADLTKFNLPTLELEKKIQEKNFDVLIDLEIDENLFNSVLASLANAKTKIGFRKPGSDKFYSFQVYNKGDNPEIIYKNLLNCPEMF